MYRFLVRTYSFLFSPFFSSPCAELGFVGVLASDSRRRVSLSLFTFCGVFVDMCVSCAGVKKKEGERRGMEAREERGEMEERGERDEKKMILRSCSYDLLF